MDRYLAVPQISWNPLSLSSAFIQFDSLCGRAGPGRWTPGHSDISHQPRRKYPARQEQKIFALSTGQMPLLTLDLGLGAAAEVVAVADTGVHLGSAQARAHTGDRTSTSGKRRNKIICDRKTKFLFSARLV